MEPLTVAKLWLLVKPIKRIRIGLARRRARKNGTELYEELPDDIEENNVIPRGKMTKGGAIIASLGPILTIAIMALNGAPADCSVDEIEAGCIAAAQAADQLAVALGTLVTTGGSMIAWRGRNRVKELTGQ